MKLAKLAWVVAASLGLSACWQSQSELISASQADPIGLKSAYTLNGRPVSVSYPDGLYETRQDGQSNTDLRFDLLRETPRGDWYVFQRAHGSPVAYGLVRKLRSGTVQRWSLECEDFLLSISGLSRNGDGYCVISNYRALREAANAYTDWILSENHLPGTVYKPVN